ncbi:MAG: type I restriction endonuclease [Phycisphaerales bacterium JB039]
MPKLRAIAERLSELEGRLETEEATKNALIMPFLQALGYDVFNPAEVVPEFVADVGIKRGEKVDYAVMRNGSPIILVECKGYAVPLTTHSSQLYRYFSVTSARIAILTNGVQYQFFSDLAAPNRMDDQPFMELDLGNLREPIVEQLQGMTKGAFDLDHLLTAATDLKLRRELKNRLKEEIANPSDAVVRALAEPVHNGRMTQSVIERFRGLITQAFTEYVRDSVDSRLKAAISQNAEANAAQADSAPQEDERGVETTVEELEGFFMVKAILREDVEPSRVHGRDAKSYFAILLDDNNRKTICRLWFNRSQKYLGVFDEQRKETRLPLDRLDDLFKHAAAIRASLSNLL